MKIKIYVIAVIFLISFVFFNCATNKGTTETDFSVSAEGTSEGILLHFENIPDDTTDLSLVFKNVNAEDLDETNVMVNYDTLEEVKKTGLFLCPFGRNGDEYFIKVIRLVGSEFADIAVTGVIAGDGIYLTNNPSLQFTNKNNSLVLSEMPVFSEEVSFSEYGSLRYYTSLSDERWGIHSVRTNELTIDFYPTTEDKNYLTQNHNVDFTEDKAVFATAYCAVDYGNLEWLISLAQSEDVMVSLE